MEEDETEQVSSTAGKPNISGKGNENDSGKEVDDETFIVSESADEEKGTGEKVTSNRKGNKNKGDEEMGSSDDADEDGNTSDDESEEDEEDEESDGDDDESGDDSDDEISEVAPVLEKRKPLTNAQIEEMNRRIKNTGVVYLSTIPPGMRWTEVMQRLKEFGEINHSHLQEAPGSSKRRKNQVSFSEGWVEFVNKKDAKTCASQLNGRIVGGKKSGKYRDYMWNMKYLHGFKWPQLLEMMNYEKHLRNDKLKLEFTKQRKQDEKYLANVSKSNRLKRKREASQAGESVQKAEGTEGTKGTKGTIGTEGTEAKKQKKE